MADRISSMEMGNLVWECLQNSPIGHIMPMYWHHHPNNPSGEFVVIWPLSASSEGIQVGYINVNLYVPDKSPTIDRQRQRAPDMERLGALSSMACKALKCYPLQERWFFDVGEEALVSENDIPYTFASYEVKLKKY